MFLHRDEKEPLDQEVESENEEDDSEEEMETGERQQQEVRSLGSVLEPSLQLSKEEEREVRRVRKMDFSWVSSCVKS